MKIGVDKAQKEGKHETKHKWLMNHGNELVSLPLPVGDYILIDDAVQAVLDRKAKRGIDVKKMDLLGVTKVSVDTKSGLNEVYQNLCGASHPRFRDECLLAQENGISLIVLVEDGYKVRTLEDVKDWVNPRIWTYCRRNRISTKGDVAANIREFVEHGGQKPPQSGEWMYKSMKTIEERYGVRWEFCAKPQSGQRIMELLSGKGNA